MNKNQKRLLNYSYFLLARRRYTVHEMVEKIYTKNQTLKESCTDAELQEILEALTKANFLNDQDYIYFYIESQLRKKPLGINKIIANLQKKGLERADIKKVYNHFSIDEFTLATEALNRKVNHQRLSSLAVISKQNYQKIKRKYFRYLQSRGFSADICLKTISTLPNFSQSDQIDS